ncbi:hypothetical protein NFH98_20955 [Halomonas sp. H33-56]|uniref:hypothetical protein n=1 Tax=Halomonas sp. H33-56 TaxID=2950873 RepID=UPI0032DF6292
MHHHPNTAQRWERDAMLTDGIDGELARIGARLIDQAYLDQHYRDQRLMDLLGHDWYARMIRFASRRPNVARQVWLYMIEHRGLPPRRGQ